MPDVVTTDSVSFGRIGDFENSSAPRPRQGTCGQWTIYVGDQHRSLLMRPAKPAAARVKSYFLGRSGFGARQTLGSFPVSLCFKESLRHLRRFDRASSMISSARPLRTAFSM